MTSPAALTGSHLRTYHTIFQHPVSHNLGWHEVHALLRQLGQVDGEPNGNLKVSRNGHVLILHPPRTKDVSETDQFVAWLQQHRPEVAQRVVGTEVVDGHHLTEAQMLAKAREFYPNARIA